MPSGRLKKVKFISMTPDPILTPTLNYNHTNLAFPLTPRRTIHYPNSPIYRDSCGTSKGYNAHHVNGEVACRDCKADRARYTALVRRRNPERAASDSEKSLLAAKVRKERDIESYKKLVERLEYLEIENQHQREEILGYRGYLDHVKEVFDAIGELTK